MEGATKQFGFVFQFSPAHFVQAYNLIPQSKYIIMERAFVRSQTRVIEIPLRNVEIFC